MARLSPHCRVYRYTINVMVNGICLLFNRDRYGAEMQRKCLAAVALVSQQRPVTEYSLTRNLLSVIYYGKAETPAGS